jgi:hypothetical protein
MDIYTNTNHGIKSWNKDELLVISKDSDCNLKLSDYIQILTVFLKVAFIPALILSLIWG